MTTYMAAVMKPPIEAVRDLHDVRGTQRRNIARMTSAVDRLMQMDAPLPRLIVFPVQPFNTGVSVQATYEQIALDLTSPELDPLVDACRRHDCYIAGSAVETVRAFPGRFFHSGFIFGPTGLILRSPKTQARSQPQITILSDFKAEYAAMFGDDSILPVVQTPVGALACMIESEIQAPEATRLAVSKGAQVICHPTYDEHEGVPWPTLKTSLAYVNGIYLLSSTTARETRFDEPEALHWRNGSSSIIGPDGQVEAMIQGRCEGYAVGAIDLERVTHIRKQNARFVTPAPGLYSDLYR